MVISSSCVHVLLEASDWYYRVSSWVSLRMYDNVLHVWILSGSIVVTVAIKVPIIPLYEKAFNG